MEEIIKAENLTKAYGTLLAVDHVSLWVKRGTAFGLLGANGAGKSTAGIQLMKSAFLGLTAESLALPIVVMLGVTLACSGIAVKCFRWE